MEETAEFDITPVQYAALVAVRESPNIDVARLSAVIAFDRSTLGNVVARLERKGWLMRRSGRVDKRTKLLRLTAAGRKLLKAVEPAVLRAQSRILAPIRRSERRQFVEQLKTLVALNNSHSRAPLGIPAADREREPLKPSTRSRRRGSGAVTVG